MVRRGDVWLVVLDPTIGSEIRKSRPCLVVSPAELNEHLKTVVIAPLTTGGRTTSFRVPVSFQGKQGLILLDQLRAVDKMRLARHMGKVTEKTLLSSLRVLQEIFAP